MAEFSFDVIIVGAGAAGLMAAWELTQTGKKVAVVEAKERVGGRACTIHDNRFDLPVELGAEFIHGKLESTQTLLKRANADAYKIEGDIWQNEDGNFDDQKDFIEDYSALNNKFKQLDHDISIAEFIDNYLQGPQFEEMRFTLKNYVEGYYAGDTTKASTYFLKEELNNSDDVQFRIEGGYAKLIDYLHDQCKEKQVAFFLSNPIKKIRWRKNKVEVDSKENCLTAQKVLITVPIGVLLSEIIEFSPSIPEQITAAKNLGFGPVVKTILQFDEVFWKNKELTQDKDLSKMGFLFTKKIIPTWWTFYPKEAAMLTGWSGGPHAEEIKDLSEKEILQKAMQSLSEIFSIDPLHLQQKLRAWYVARWIDDPYCLGGYSYEVVGGEKWKTVLKNGVDETIFFAGEGLFSGTEIGTVEAALVSGRDTAHQMIASFKK